MSTTKRTGEVWRIAPSGTTRVYLVSTKGNRACVHSRGQVSRWAKVPMYVETADLFDSQEEARAEYRRRRAAADPMLGFNLTSDNHGRLFIKDR